MPPSVTRAITMECLADGKDISKDVWRDCKALGVQSCKSEAVDELCDTTSFTIQEGIK